MLWDYCVIPIAALVFRTARLDVHTAVPFSVFHISPQSITESAVDALMGKITLIAVGVHAMPSIYLFLSEVLHCFSSLSLSGSILFCILNRSPRFRLG